MIKFKPLNKPPMPCWAMMRVLCFLVRVLMMPKKRGDIDLLFETGQAVDNRATTTGALYVSLIRKLGDRKIDVILKDAATPESPVLVIARQTGIQL